MGANSSRRKFPVYRHRVLSASGGRIDLPRVIAPRSLGKSMNAGAFPVTRHLLSTEVRLWAFRRFLNPRSFVGGRFRTRLSFPFRLVERADPSHRTYPIIVQNG